MKAIQIALAAASLYAFGAPQASEITDFPVPAASMLTRADVMAEAQARLHERTRHDFVGPSVTPQSTKSREEVRREAVAGHREHSAAGSADFIGGM